MNKPHEHWFNLAITKNAFEPVDPTLYQDNQDLAGQQLFTMVEYAYLLCKCGAINKVRVTQGSATDNDN